MKKSFLAMMMAVAVMFSCTEKEPTTDPDKEPDTENPENPGDENPGEEKPEPETVYVSFVKNSYEDGAQKTVVMNVLETVKVPVEVEISAESAEDLGLSVVADETYIEEYNAMDVKNYVALPAELYTIAEPVVEGLAAKFEVTLDVKKILAYAETNGKTMEEMSNHVVALKLEAEKAEVATADDMSLGYYVIVPQVIDAYIQATLTAVDELNYEYKVSVPFVNEACNITWDIEFVNEALGTEPSTEKGNYFPAKYQQASGATISNSEVKSMAPETSEVTYTISFPSYRVLGTVINIKNAKIDGVDVPVKDADETTGVKSEVVSLAPYQARYKTGSWVQRKYDGSLRSDEGDGVTSEVALFQKSLESVGLKAISSANFKFSPVSSCEYDGTDMTKTVFDGKHNTDWGIMFQATGGQQGANAWGWEVVGSYGPEDVAWALIDLGAKQAVEGIEYWRKVKGNDNDKQPYNVNTMEIYALDKCEVLDKIKLEYEASDMTYLGTIEFDGITPKEYNVLAAKFERIETQYLLIAYRPEYTSQNKCYGIHALEITLFN